ncbi:hypothetical protein ACFE04_017588 [Oxalis oulophora]
MSTTNKHVDEANKAVDRRINGGDQTGAKLVSPVAFKMELEPDLSIVPASVQMPPALSMPPPPIPTTSNATSSEDQIDTKKKRKRPCNSEYIDVVNDPVSVSSGLAPISVVPQQLPPQQVMPQGFVPMWAAIPSNGVVSNGAAAFFMIPQLAVGPFNYQPQQIISFPSVTAVNPFVNVSTRPVTSFVTTTTPVQIQTTAAVSAVSGSKQNKTTSVMAAPASTSMTTTTSTRTQMLRDFSLEIYEKEELQLMARSSHH